MTITATSEEHAREIIKDLKAKGYKYRMSYFWIQEWKNDKGDTVLVGKGYGYSKVNYMCGYY